MDYLLVDEFVRHRGVSSSGAEGKHAHRFGRRCFIAAINQALNFGDPPDHDALGGAKWRRRFQPESESRGTAVGGRT